MPRKTKAVTMSEDMGITNTQLANDALAGDQHARAALSARAERNGEKSRAARKWRAMLRAEDRGVSTLAESRDIGIAEQEANPRKRKAKKGSGDKLTTAERKQLKSLLAKLG